MRMGRAGGLLVDGTAGMAGDLGVANQQTFWPWKSPRLASPARERGEHVFAHTLSALKHGAAAGLSRARRRRTNPCAGLSRCSISDFGLQTANAIGVAAMDPVCAVALREAEEAA